MNDEEIMRYLETLRATWRKAEEIYNQIKACQRQMNILQEETENLYSEVKTWIEQEILKQEDL